MSPPTSLPIKPAAPPEAAPLQRFAARLLAAAFLGALYLLLPLLPLLASIAYQRFKYVRQYGRTLKKMVIHLQALSEGPVRHYIQDVMGRQTSIPADIQGSCTQCGQCCLDKRCVFLEQSGDKYLCGVYHSPLRRFSNCGSFPLSAHDIERYDCPGYSVAQEVPIHWFPAAGSAK